MKKEGLIAFLALIVFVFVVVMGGGWLMRKVKIDDAVVSVQQAGTDAAGNIIVMNDCVYLPEGVSIDDVDGLSNDMMALILACSDRHALEVNAHLAEHAITEIKSLGISTQWAGAASDFSRALGIIGITVMALCGLGLFLYMKAKGE